MTQRRGAQRCYVPMCWESSAGCPARRGRASDLPVARPAAVLCMRAVRTMSPKQLLPLGLLLSGASVSALRQPIGRITSLNRNRLVADEEDSLFYRAPRLVNHADGAA